MLQLPLMFSDHMMLQREKPVKIFGAGSPGSAVTVRLYDREGRCLAETEAAASEDGKFTAVLPALAPGLDFSLVISDGAETVTIQDVAVGDVWLAGGQSNMEFLMNTDAEMPKEREALQGLSEEVRRSLRFFGYPEISFPGMEELVDLSNYGKWRCLTEEDIVYFSAVGYYFQRKVREAVDVPVGILACNWGGTKAVCWIPEETVREAGAELWLDEYEAGLKMIPDLEKAKEAYKKTPMNVLSDPAKPNPFDAILLPGFSKARQEEVMKMFPADDGGAMAVGPLHPWRPCGLYETMLKKVMPYTLRGFLWYQGESDETHAALHTAVMKALIRKWREDFCDETLPFYMVQIAPFGWWLGNGSDNYAALREAQEKATDETENAWLAAMGDAGMRFDIHPKHKRKPGERLALLALSHTYGLDVPSEAPRAAGLEYDGDTAVVRFTNGAGLHLSEAENGGLTAEEAEKYNFSDPDEPAAMSPEENLNSLIQTVPEGEVSAEIRDDTLRVTLRADGKTVRPKELRFAWTGYYEVNVKNKAGLPVFPFVI